MLNLSTASLETAFQKRTIPAAPQKPLVAQILVKGFNRVEYRVRPSGPVVQSGILTSLVRPKNVRFANQLMV